MHNSDLLKEKHSYKSFDDMCQTLKIELAKLRARRLLANSSLKMFIQMKPHRDEFVEVIMNNCELAVSGSYKNPSLFIEDPDTSSMISDVKFIEKILKHLEGAVILQSTRTEIVIRIQNIQQKAKDLQTSLKYKTSIRQLTI